VGAEEERREGADLLVFWRALLAQVLKFCSLSAPKMRGGHGARCEKQKATTCFYLRYHCFLVFGHKDATHNVH
jgi:hypothetical protein